MYDEREYSETLESLEIAVKNKEKEKKLLTKFLLEACDMLMGDAQHQRDTPSEELKNWYRRIGKIKQVLILASFPQI